MDGGRVPTLVGLGAPKRFTVRRIIGGGDLWVTELVITYDGKPSYTVSIMEFSGDKVVGKHSILRIHSWLPHHVLSGSNGWTRNLAGDRCSILRWRDK